MKGPLSQKDLDALAIGPKDLHGYEMTTAFGRGSDGHEVPVHLQRVSARARTSPAQCQPLSDNALRVSNYQPLAVVEQTLTHIDPDDGRNAEIALVSYQPGDSPKVLADLRQALKSCTAFRTAGTTTSFKNPRQLPTPHLGDEALQFQITMVTGKDAQDAGTPVRYLLVRKGSVILWSQAIAGITNDGDNDTTIPADAVNAQLAKLPGTAAR